MFFGTLVFSWVLHEKTSWTQFLCANFKPFVLYNLSMWRQENFFPFRSYRLKIEFFFIGQILQLWRGMVVAFAWKVLISKCFAKVIYGKNSLGSFSPCRKCFTFCRGYKLHHNLSKPLKTAIFKMFTCLYTYMLSPRFTH